MGYNDKVVLTSSQRELIKSTKRAMSGKNTKLTENQLAYGKQLVRLDNAIKRAEKQGYRFDSIPIPDVPKRITKQAIQELKGTQTRHLYENATHYDIETGEIRKAKDRIKDVRKEASKKGQETKKKKKGKGGQTGGDSGGTGGGDWGDSYAPDFSEIVLNNYIVSLEAFGDNAKAILNEWLGRLREKFGDADVAEMLQKGAENGSVLTYEIAYNGDKLAGYIRDMLDYLPEGGEMYTEDLMEALEEMEEWSGLQ